MLRASSLYGCNIFKEEMLKHHKQFIRSEFRWAQELMRPHIYAQRQLLSILGPPEISKIFDEIYQAQKNHDRERRTVESLSSEALAKFLFLAPSTLTRKAAAAWKKECGPAPLQGIRDWWVVEAPNNADGGRGCGWRFARAHEARSLWC
ncbi:MAG: hypothetical protein ACKO3F_15275 [Cyanobium sp.]